MPWDDSPRREVVSHIPAGVTSLLDVGCGEGGFAAALGVARPEIVVSGVEPDARAAKVARGRMHSVYEGPFPDALGVAPGRYDCISFLDSLEHMIDPWHALRAARGLLTSNGCVVASIPNVRHFYVLRQLLRGDWRYEEQGLLDRTHLRFFTRKSMVRLFEESQFRVEELAPLAAWTGSRLHKLGRVSATVADMAVLQYVVRARPDGAEGVGPA